MVSLRDSVSLYKVWDLDEALVPEHQMISDKEHNQYIEECIKIDTDQLNTQEEKHTMANLKQTALDYVPQTTLNIADLEIVSVDLDVKTKTGTRDDGEEYSYDYVEIDGKQYRVPKTVLTELKEHLAANPNMTKFKVNKTGVGLKTRYSVIPIVN